MSINEMFRQERILEHGQSLELEISGLKKENARLTAERDALAERIRELEAKPEGSIPPMKRLEFWRMSN